MTSLDPRLRVMSILLVPAFVGHTIQLLGEDRILSIGDDLLLRVWRGAEKK